MKSKAQLIYYHGTNNKKTADKILKEGFKQYTFFSKDLYDAICYGGKYIFRVWFYKAELPNNWQVRCVNKVPKERIFELIKFKKDKLFFNKNTDFDFDYSPGQQPDYRFELIKK